MREIIYANYYRMVIFMLLRLQTMPSSLRLSTNIQEKLRNACIKVNKKLINKGHQPVRDSELAKMLIEEASKRVDVDNSGNITIE